MNPPLVDNTSVQQQHHRYDDSHNHNTHRSNRHQLPLVNGFHHDGNTDYGAGKLRTSEPPPTNKSQPGNHVNGHAHGPINDNDDEEYYSGLARRPSNLDRDAKLRAQSFIMNKRRNEAKEKADGSFRMKTTLTKTPQIKISRHFSSYEPPSESEEQQVTKSPANPSACEDKKEICTSNYQNEKPASYTSPTSTPQKEAKTSDMNGHAGVKLNERMNQMSLTSAFSSSSDESDHDNERHDRNRYRMESSNSSSGNNLKLSNNTLARQMSEDTRSTSFQDDQSTSMMISPIVDTIKHVNSNSHAAPKKYTFIRSHSLIPSYKESRPSHRDSESYNTSMYDLINNYSSSKNFILKPATIGLLLKCQLFRKKKFGSCKYRFYLENLDGQLILVMTADKRKKSKTPTYIINYISFDLNDVQKYEEIPIAKLKSNLLGTQFTLYDLGAKPTGNGPAGNSGQQATPSPSPSHLRRNSPSFMNNDRASTFMKSSFQDDMTTARREYVSISYALNPFGIRGPRTMSVIIPGMDANHNREDFQLRSESDSLLQAWKSIEQHLISTNSNPKSTDNVSSANASGNPKKLMQSISQCEPSPTKSLNGNVSRSSQKLDKADGPENVKKSLSASHLSNGDGRPNQAKAARPVPERNVVKLMNKSPTWHSELKSFALNFNGRVTKSSAKNYQIIHEAQSDYVVTQFGKVENDMYTCDYMYPLCALQAFGIALSSIDTKLGCD